MALIGYAVDRHGMTAQEQKVKLLAAGVEERHIHVEPSKPRRGEQPQWHWCQMALRRGDVLVVEGFHALGRTKLEVLDCLTGMEALAVQIVSLGDALDTREGGAFPFAAFAKALRRLDTHMRRAGKRGTGLKKWNAAKTKRGRPAKPIPPEAAAAWQDIWAYPSAALVAKAFGVDVNTLKRRLGPRPTAE